MEIGKAEPFGAFQRALFTLCEKRVLPFGLKAFTIDKKKRWR